MSLMMETIQLNLACGQCGHGPVARTPEGGAVCKSCHADLGSWDEVLEQARALVFDALRDDFADLVSKEATAKPDLRVAA